MARRTVKDTDGQGKPMRRTRWSAPDPEWGDASHPLALLVFNQVGKRPVLKQMERFAGLTREHWQGPGADGFHLYKGKMPIVATTLELLRGHGPPGPCSGASAVRTARTSGTRSATPAGTPLSHAAQKTRGAVSGRKQPNARLSGRCARTADGSSPTTGGGPASRSAGRGRCDSHPHLCDDCKSRALEAERQAEQAERERQEQERQEEAAQASKAGGWLGCWRG
ncbi:hypothetical protein ACFS5L_40380 [Streptomyces phyllanthi]|uniref:Uncharacterized protein n=1 Tax=Streptomyces phyllanthi TaxID=1803180 RepID=A0A5N8WED6_9ACTN|nr:hypothetical protein [Streptomyces phyllanthi]MPY45216.1 hypothetical protein [Streptomyces phyllanthi]